jgi:hypothetical protein
MKTISVEEAHLLIGKPVSKKSGKPFKSGNKVNTVLGLTTNPATGKVAYTFLEDDSVVDAFICVEVSSQMLI